MTTPDAGQRLIGSLRLIASIYCGNWMATAACDAISEIERLREVERERDRYLNLLRDWTGSEPEDLESASRSTGAADVGEEHD